jgi:hypothetical protein
LLLSDEIPPTTGGTARYIAARDKAASLYIFRVVLLLLRQRRGASGIDEP